MTLVDLEQLRDAVVGERADDEPALLLTVEQSARLLSIGRTFAWELIDDGRLPSVRLGRKRLVRRTDLVAFVDGLEVAS